MLPPYFASRALVGTTASLFLCVVAVVASDPVADAPKQSPDPLEGPPFVTCKAWIIADADTGEILAGDNQDDERNPASITKIMTALVVLKLAEKSPEVWEEMITFSERADETPGSSCWLKTGERLPVEELIYGLLLPSGNDASVAIAEHFGPRLAQGKETGYDAFIRTMCETAQQLGMERTRYGNPHGLTEEGHLTTAADMVKLTREAMKYEKFRETVATRRHSTTVQTPDGNDRNVTWNNTNRLLKQEGYLGVKTGTTRAAGACLVSAAQRNERRLIMVVLGSSSSDARYADARNLYRWMWKRLAADSADD
ncbi:D-alanyl-D-alanine carboxypeptidase DacF precursor [Rosistilla carotiformis]|uniref:D-alanyl-D-alanine carboxypeptidase DacF n=1 Tax=Rosistilla carotiformis TaxID=2528017 RepID=A0A518JTG6_9BACT|nr:D-alanyl-D-alanine carboxypeptidase family protein [Rosistilla carotiformis]QDV68834.1 D-alanyl-D-alanine carboxypeptidase DacF precursor [Rosistilla carotiformis]